MNECAGFEACLAILKNLNMEIQFAYDPKDGLIGDNQEERLRTLSRRRHLNAKDLRLALPTLHDLEDLENSIEGMQAAARVVIELARNGLLDTSGRVMVEHYLIGLRYPDGELRSFPEIRELRTREDHEKLNLTPHPQVKHPKYPHHHFVTFRVGGQSYYYWSQRGSYTYPIYAALKHREIPIVLADDPKYAEALRSAMESDNESGKMLAQAMRMHNFHLQFFAPCDGMAIMVAGACDFCDPGGVPTYSKDDKMYVQAVHASFRHSRYISLRTNRSA